MNLEQFLNPGSAKAMEKELERLVSHLETLKIGCDEYISTLECIKKLSEAREKKNDHAISSEAILAATVNIVGILLIMNFERTGILTTKAIGFLSKGRNI